MAWFAGCGKHRRKGGRYAAAVLAAAVMLASCFQLTPQEITLERFPGGTAAQSGEFALNGEDLLIVAVSGGVLRRDLDPGDFALTRGGLTVALPRPVRSGDRYVLFGFDLPPPYGAGYSLTVRPRAMQSGVPGTVSVRAVSTGRPLNLAATVFGNTVIRYVGYGNGRFVAVGDSGRMAYSVDGGASWIPVQPGEGVSGNRFVGTIHGVAASDSEFFAVGAGSRIAFSPNAIRWIGHRLHDGSAYGETNFAGNDVLAVAFGPGASGGGRFVVAGGGGRSMFRWYGDHWRQATGFNPAHSINALAWGDTGGYGRLVAGGSNGSLYFAHEGLGVMDWRPAGGGAFGAYAVRAVAYGNGVFVAGGDGGVAARSSTGEHWNRSATTVFGGSGILAVTFGSGVFVAAAHNGVMAKSGDGEQWLPVQANGFTAAEQISGVATDGRGRFVAVGNSYATGAARIVSWYQAPAATPDGGLPPDGDRPQPPPFIPVGSWGTVAPVGTGSPAIHGIAWNGAVYVAVGEGMIATSGDGTGWSENTAQRGLWTTAAGGRVNFRDVTWGAGRFVAVGYWADNPGSVGVIAVSDANGQNWTLAAAPVLRHYLHGGVSLVVNPRVYGVAFAGGRYVAVGERGWSAWSVDTVTWHPVRIDPFGLFAQHEINQTATSVATDGSVFLVGATMGRLASSSDGGLSWNWIANGLLGSDFRSILTVAYGNGRFIAAGADGMMRVAESSRIGSAENWSFASPALGTAAINSVSWGGGHYLAVSSGGGLAVSANGLQWTAVSAPGFDRSQDIFSTAAGGRFVAGGRGQIRYSR